MATKKELARMPRRVWRMTSGAPQGEYLELVPKEVQVEPQKAHQRTAHSGPTTAYGAVSLSAGKNEATQPTPTTTESREAAPPRPRSTPSEQVTEASVSPSMKTWVLRPAQVESWQSSSFDLSSGCTVREVTDTIPGELFDELFKPDPSEPAPPARRRRE